jgi:alpha-galactosidase
LAQESPISLERGQEYAAYIINALRGGENFQFNGNVSNTGLITNLPAGACVEVPVYADRSGFRPVYVGALPPQCVALTHLNATIEEMAVEAALSGNPRLVFQAIAHDPLTAAVLSLAEIKEMVNEMFLQNRDYLPQFKHLEL